MPHTLQQTKMHFHTEHQNKTRRALCSNIASSLNIACSLTLPVLSSAIASLTPTRPSRGISAKNISRLQRLQSTFARVVICQRGSISISKTLQELHWLRIKWRIAYKVATLAYKLLESGEQTYMKSRITSKISRRALRSSADDRQHEPCSSHPKIGSRAFRCAAPAIWNCLPYDIRAAPSVSIFRSRHKTHYFKLHFNVVLWF